MSIDQDELPPRWATATIGELIGRNGIFVDGDWVESKDQHPDGSVRLIQLADIGDGHFRDRSARFLTHEKAIELGCTFLEKRDLLIARMPDPLGRCCIFPLDRADAYVTVVDVCVVRVGSAPINPQYLMYAINSGAIRAEIADLQSGSTRKRISRGNLATIKLPIAPRREQDRIVGKIEDLFSEIENGMESIDAAREKIKSYKALVLKQAFEGKLTENWRSKNSAGLLNPKELSDRVLAERATRYMVDLERWQASLRKRDKKSPRPAKPSAPDEAEFPDFSGLPSLPHGWAYIPLGAIAYSIRNGISKKPNETGDLRIFRISAVRPMVFDMVDFRRIDDDPEFRSYRLRRGDIVFTRYNGSRAYVGVAAMYSSDEEFVYPDKLIRCDVQSAVIDPGYIEKAVNCGVSRSFIEGRIRTTAGQAGISGSDLKAMPVPICSIEEQTEINAMLEVHLSGISQLEAEIETALRKGDALRQTILKKAFSGRLVAQDQSDEPASVLLERIRAERKSADSGRKKKGNGKKEAA